jgi:hypothetical protein
MEKTVGINTRRNGGARLKPNIPDHERKIYKNKKKKVTLLPSSHKNVAFS